jgi:PAP2 superfamily
MWLPWKPALELAAVSLTVGLCTKTSLKPKLRVVSAVAKETSLILGLYALWQRAGEVSIMHVGGALERGRQLVDFEQAIHLPSEATLQRLILPHPLWVQFSNGYYAIMHVPALVIFLMWAFWRDRIHYARWRTVMAASTAACLAIQLIPVAPPRMLTDLGFVDTALLFKQSVYSALGRGMAGQLAAMPSVHVGWALIIALGMWQITKSKWRWLGVMHAVLTVLVVSATANHYWVDGIVAALLIGISLWIDHRVRSRFGAGNVSRRVRVIASPEGRADDLAQQTT